MPEPFIKPEWIKLFHPENLIPGKHYRWTFKEQGGLGPPHPQRREVPSYGSGQEV